MIPDPQPQPSSTLPWHWRIVVVLALVATVLPNFILLLTADHSRFWITQAASGVLLALAPLYLGCRPRTALILLSPFAAFTPVSAAYVFATGFPPSLMALQVLREATPDEIANFMPQLLLAAGATLLILIGYWLLARRCGRQTWRLPVPVRVIAMTLLAISLGKDIAGHGVRTGGLVLLSRLERMHPVSPLALQGHFLVSGAAVPDRNAVLRDNVVKQAPGLQGREICVLVIGESARRTAFGLYQPEPETTPRLRQRELVVFKDATAPATVTFQSVPTLLTGRLPGAGEMLPYNRLGLVEAFRIAGFHTAWVSMQQADGEVSSLITAFTGNAHETSFLNGRMDRSKYRRVALKDDGALLGPLESLISAHPEKLFVVLHTFGSHAPYLERYPPAFEKWPVDADAKRTSWRWLPPYSEYQRRQIDHSYLNSILYTDWVIDAMIARLQEAGGVASLVYISDHGENDAGARTMPAAHAVPTRDVLGVPLFFWLSPEFRARRPEVVQALVTNAAKRVSGLDLFSTVCEMHGLQTAAYEREHSLANREYKERPRFAVLMDGTIVPASE